MDIKKRIRNAINYGVSKKDISLLVKELLQAEHKAEWDKAMRVEYEGLFPTYRDMTWEEYKGINRAEDEIYYGKESYPDSVDKPQVRIDYSEDESYVVYNDWLNETKVVQEAKYEQVQYEDGSYSKEMVEVEPEITETVRPYIAIEVTDEMIDEYINTNLKDYINERIYKRLDELDIKSIRAIRDNDEEFIRKYSLQSEELRKKLI
jgi:hypothetical protein